MQIDAQTIAEAGGVTPAFARMILAGSREPSLALALRVFDATGAQLGPLKALDATGIEYARKMVKAA